MDIKVKQKHKNPSLHREEIVFEIKAKITPQRKELREKIAALNSTKPELVIIEKISNSFGSTDSKGRAFVYENKEALEKTEVQNLISKNTGAKKRKEAEKEAKKPEKENQTEEKPEKKE